MPADRAVDPIQALQWCAEKLNPIAPETFSPAEAPRGFLASDVDLSVSGGTGARSFPVAARNGYAVDGAVREDAVHGFLGTIAAGGQVYDPQGRRLRADPPAAPSTPDRVRGIWRVESGARLPEGTDRVVPVSGGLLLGDQRIRLHRAVDAGAGVLHSAAPPREALVIPAGSRLDDRLRSLLLEHGVERVRLRRAFSVGYGTIGDELTDLTVTAVEPGQTRDLSGYWLGDAIANCGQKPVALGIIPDDPHRIREAVHRCRARQADVAVLAGGVGSGFTDRVVETLRQLDARVLFTEVELGDGLGFVLAKTQGVDLLCLCGRPLWCSALFDLFVRPALRARAGASSDDWDWSRCEQLLEPEGLEKWAPAPDGSWNLFPALSPAGPGARLRVPRIEETLTSFPWLPDQRGWVVARFRGEEFSPVLYAPSVRDAGAVA